MEDWLADSNDALELRLGQCIITNPNRYAQTADICS